MPSTEPRLEPILGFVNDLGLRAEIGLELGDELTHHVVGIAHLGLLVVCNATLKKVPTRRM